MFCLCSTPHEITFCILNFVDLDTWYEIYSKFGVSFTLKITGTYLRSLFSIKYEATECEGLWNRGSRRGTLPKVAKLRREGGKSEGRERKHQTSPPSPTPLSGERESC